MDHEQVQQMDLIDRYLMGRLPEEECSRFEEHFVDCPECIARLQSTKSFLRDLRFVAAENALQTIARPSESVFKQFFQSLFRRPAILAVCSIILAASIGTVFAIGYNQLKTELNEAKNYSQQLEQRYEEERKSADNKIQELTDQGKRLEEKLKSEEQHDKEATKPDLMARLDEGGAAPIYTLMSQRSSTQNTFAQIPLSDSNLIFILTVQIESELPYKSYNLKVIDDQQLLIKKQEDLKPDSASILSVWLRTARFQRGNYSLVVEGVKKEGGIDNVGNYPFSVIKPR